MSDCPPYTRGLAVTSDSHIQTVRTVLGTQDTRQAPDARHTASSNENRQHHRLISSFTTECIDRPVPSTEKAPTPATTLNPNPFAPFFVTCMSGAFRSLQQLPKPDQTATTTKQDSPSATCTQDSPSATSTAEDKQHVHRQLPCSAPPLPEGLALSTSPTLPPNCLSAKGRDGHIAADSKGVWSPGLHLGVEVAGAELEGVRALLALLLVFVRTHGQCVCPAQACRRSPCYAELQPARSSKPDTHPKDGGIHEKCEHAVFTRGRRVSTY